MNETREQRYIPTGVPGLDDVLMGGFLEEGFYLLQGDPGSGKTTIALQYVLGRVAAGERCLYITLTETRRDLENACRSHGWRLDGIDLLDLTRSIAESAQETGVSIFNPSETELVEMTRTVMAEVERVQPRHLVFDGLSELRLMAGDALRYRRRLLALKEFLANRGITVLALDDRAHPFTIIQPESLVGGNLVLEKTVPEYGRARRRLLVTKVRGRSFREGFHDYEITQGGVRVHPRLVAAEHHDQFGEEVCPSGIANLDEMLGGGLQAGTTTLFLGPAGVGKSTTAMQFVVSALQQGHLAAAYIFDEVLGTFIARSEKLCQLDGEGVRDYIASGRLHAQQVDPAEMSAGAFAHEVHRAVDAGARFVLIDSLNGYLNTMPQERYLTSHLHELFAYLNQKGVTTLMVVAQHGMIASSGAEIDVSYLADTVLLYRYFEADAAIHQAISVFKKRTGAHQRSIRQLSVHSDGLRIGEPLHGFQGIMTGVPEYQGATALLPPEQRTDA